MELDEEKLINLVSGYRELYDLQHEHYMNATRRENIWKEIAVVLNGVSVKLCKERWKSLRDGYNRSHKRQKTKSGDGATASKLWRYEKQMAFLRPYIQIRPPKGGLEEIAEEGSISSPTSKTNSSPASTSSAMFDEIRNRKVGKSVAQKSNVADVLEKYLKKRENNARAPTSPIHSFFTAMADTVVTFPPEVQLKLKNQLYLAVSQAEFDMQHQPVQIYLQNISTQENQSFATDTRSPPSRSSTRYLSSESEMGYELSPLPAKMPEDYTTQNTALETPSTSTGPKECNTETSQSILNTHTPKRQQYYITPDGLVVQEL